MQLELRFPESVPSNQISQQFIQGMMDRMAMGYYNYQHCKPLSTTAPLCDLIKCCEKRIERYQEDGNTEALLDAANFLMMEFMFPKHPRQHFKSTTASESPGVVTVDGETVRQVL